VLRLNQPIPKFAAMAKRNPRDEVIITRFGKNVRKQRELSKLTMLQLAVLCQVEVGTISTVERGLVNCSISTAFAISVALNTTLDELLASNLATD
jgi:transcriptional regulator with XRE-family HTH domain